MQEVFEAAAHVAKSKASVLIRGETGTGKELIARAVHDTQPAVLGHVHGRVNCGALTESLLESELFGHVKGPSPAPSTTGRACSRQPHKGSIFLDEINETSPSSRSSSCGSWRRRSSSGSATTAP